MDWIVSDHTKYLSFPVAVLYARELRSSVTPSSKFQLPSSKPQDAHKRNYTNVYTSMVLSSSSIQSLNYSNVFAVVHSVNHLDPRAVMLRQKELQAEKGRGQEGGKGGREWQQQWQQESRQWQRRVC